jgi:hypothetical protein
MVDIGASHHIPRNHIRNIFLFCFLYHLVSIHSLFLDGSVVCSLSHIVLVALVAVVIAFILSFSSL